MSGILKKFLSSFSNSDDTKNKMSIEISLEKKVNKENFSNIFYSQDGEDMVLSAFYAEQPAYEGFYVDLGALHPFRFSNTQYFYEKGWRGINVDATPRSMKLFNEFRPNDINLEIGVSSSSKFLTFYCFEEPALNSFNKEISESRILKGLKLISKKKVKTLSINKILEKYLPENKKIDFINIDLEGLEIDTLKTIDWQKYAPDYFLIEELPLANKDLFGLNKSEIYKILLKNGYGIVAKTRRTLIFKRNIF